MKKRNLQYTGRSKFSRLLFVSPARCVRCLSDESAGVEATAGLAGISYTRLIRLFDSLFEYMDMSFYYGILAQPC
jgi:hypothetical protein